MNLKWIEIVGIEVRNELKLIIVIKFAQKFASLEWDSQMREHQMNNPDDIPDQQNLPETSI